MNTLTGPLRKAGAAAGSGDFLALWAGQAVGLNRALPAAALVETLLEETRARLAAWRD
jgi:nitronate monooxygenase